MKTITIRDAKESLSQCIVQAQRDKILITKHGDPAAILWGVEGKDLEDVFYMTNPDFWKMVQQRRSSRPVPWRIPGRRDTARRKTRKK